MKGYKYSSAILIMNLFSLFISLYVWSTNQKIKTSLISCSIFQMSALALANVSVVPKTSPALLWNICLQQILAGGLPAEMKQRCRWSEERESRRSSRLRACELTALQYTTKDPSQRGCPWFHFNQRPSRQAWGIWESLSLLVCFYLINSCFCIAVACL